MAPTTRKKDGAGFVSVLNPAPCQKGDILEPHHPKLRCQRVSSNYFDKVSQMKYPSCYVGLTRILGVWSSKRGMAVPEHVEILRQGSEVWSRWRMDCPGEAPDLSRTLFQGADLRDFDLSRTNLQGAYLRNANLSQAVLSEADLAGACLIGADLTGADLSRAAMIGAELTRADLCGTNLWGAELSQANLRYANLQEIRNWKRVGNLNLVNLYRVANSPDGFREWATRRGAVSLAGQKWKALKERNSRNGNGEDRRLGGVMGSHGGVPEL